MCPERPSPLPDGCFLESLSHTTLSSESSKMFSRVASISLSEREPQVFTLSPRVHIHMCIGTHGSMHTRAWRPEETLRCSTSGGPCLQGCSPPCMRQACSSPVRSDWLANVPQGSSCLPILGIQMGDKCSSEFLFFYKGSGDWMQVFMYPGQVPYQQSYHSCPSNYSLLNAEHEP